MLFRSGFGCACHGNGAWIRKPAPAWHLLPVALGGTLPNEYAEHSPALLACHAQRVAAGFPGLLGMLSSVELYDHPPVRPRWDRRGNTGLLTWCVRDLGWVVDGAGDGPEIGEAGKSCADAAAIAAGYALLDADGLRLPPVAP